ncbi:MAG: tripartite tricarboxylate transporter substrate binding protein [Polaromonas sp.]|uniref:Bug family tripartite tricarboxylate transporter substrate binding protein n=1 Tax=Polaromonas sp. TaxID=1869339 RepID=UPI0025E8C4B7|nr:tripartite tricarboxylate transporter substrate binding protein [Polaromonas sp.]MBI2728425.1 tripartite tricarboxylate transporter substrate binding protein [Polaromonas sp.]
MQTERVALKLVLAFAMAAAVVVPAAAQVGSYPNKPVTIVVGFSAGGSSDALARIVAEKLAIGLGQPVLVENRPGVASIVGAAFVAKAKPDGYTLLMGASGPNVFNYALYARLPYAPQEFAPVSLLGTFPLLLLANANNPAKNVQELIAQSKQNPDKSNYGASSASFQLVTELFNTKTGARFAHIPYKGSNDAITALISGDVTMTLVDAGAASAVLQGGRVKALAVTSSERLKDMPGVPTLSELGVDLKVSFWSGLLAPAGTPAPVIKRLQEEITKVMNMPDVKSRFTAMSVVPASSTPEEFSKVIATEIPLWKQLALDNNIKAN